jgi:hypothetical protein
MNHALILCLRCLWTHHLSIKKTAVLYQATLHIAYSEPTITVKGEKLKAVDTFTYLGSTEAEPLSHDMIHLYYLVPLSKGDG